MIESPWGDRGGTGKRAVERFHARGSLFGAIEGVFPGFFRRDQAGRGVS